MLDGRSSDLLPGFLSSHLFSETVTVAEPVYMEFTAAGQFRIYTGFPFNPGQRPGTKSGSKVRDLGKDER